MKKLALISINNPSLDSAIKAKELLMPLKNTYETNVFFRKGEKNPSGENLIPYDNIDSLLEDIWDEYDILVWFVATGIVVRKIAPRLKSKTSDPGVLVMSLNLKQVIPLVSGHLGGANSFSEKLSEIIPDCVSFVTTATDQTNNFAFDLFAQEHGFKIENISCLAKVSNALINSKSVDVITYPEIMEQIKVSKGYKEELCKFIDISNTIIEDHSPSEQVIISPIPYLIAMEKEPFKIRIPYFFIGMGMDRGTPMETLFQKLKQFLIEHNLRPEDIKGIASFDAKSDEKGLLELAKELKLPLSFYAEDEINNLEQELSKSRATDFFNIKGVAEPSAILASKHKRLFLKKHVYKSVTISAAF